MKKSPLKIVKSTLVLHAASLLLFSACVEEKITQKISIETEGEKSNFGDKIKISPMDETVTVKKNIIILSPAEENTVYTISGYFDGQIVSTVKNTIIKLNNAYLENSSGKSAVKASAKAEISTAKDSTNYIVSRGKSFAKSAALQSKKGLVLGGSGTLYIKGRVCHGVESDDIKIKGSGIFYIEGARKGSALSCENLTVEEGKSFTAYMLNSKNGIKADKTINIASGNFHIYDNGTALKTNTSKESPKQKHSITLSGGKFYLHENEKFVSTEENEFDSRGAEIISEELEVRS